MRKSGVSNEDATRIFARMSVTSRVRVSCTCTLENDTDTRTNGQHYTGRSRPPANQSGKRVASWMEKSPDTPNMHGLLRT